ncbi:MAG: DUF5655 domain-containing protein [Acidobacteria bacterium]|nr:DUF5655 domain-containing protein [Acidobacteriota bacterium]
MPVERFRATILKSGTNPYVDVPSRLSRAFASYARAGRITVHGKLNRTPIQATLIPARRGRHRLFINGGMRAAAGVSTGETVSLTLQPAAPGSVRIPADLRAAMRKAPGTSASFAALLASHRRELLRYVDDARTPANRRQRIFRTLDHLRGKNASGPARRAVTQRPLWTCPRCGHEFVNRNQWHSCKRHKLSDLFAGKPARVRELFQRFEKMIQACGPVKRLVYREKVAFMVRVRFAGAVLRSGWLDVGFWLPRRLDSPRFRRVETLYPYAHVHLLRITQPSDLDAQVASWIKEAYAVGRQQHLRGQ